MDNKLQIMTKSSVPCSIWDGGQDRECGRDANLIIMARSVAGDRVSPTGYKWSAQPICPRCVQELYQMYLPDDLITLTEAAQVLGVKAPTISGYIARGKLTTHTDPDEPNPQRSRRVSRAAVEDLRGGK